MKHILAVPCVLGLMLTIIGSAQAALLTALFNGGTITSGDKLFDQWGLDSATTSDGHVINTGNIDVTAVGPVGSNPLDPGAGVHFNVLNNELQVTGDGIFAFIDLQFRFRVSVLDAGPGIKDLSMVTNSTLTPVGDGRNDLGTFILESVGSAAGLNDLGVANAEYSVLDDVLTNSLSGSATFVPRPDVWVNKNILVWSQDVTDTAALNSFEQRFSQTQVPEPSTLALLGIAGLAGLVSRRRA